MRSVIKMIGKNIKLARVKKDWTQADLAHLLNVEQAYVSRIESGAVAVSCERIYEIMNLLDCDTVDIFPPISTVRSNVS